MTDVTAGRSTRGNSGRSPGDHDMVDMSSLTPPDRAARLPLAAAGARRALASVATAALLAVGLACGGDDASAELSPAAERGRDISNTNGCAACHGTNGQGGAGPAWQGLYGSDVELEDGTVVVADEAYLKRAIVDPDAERTAGSQLRMPMNDLGAEEVADVIAYIRALSDPDDAADGAGDG
jgi:cytochrome c oxidase subunit 2